jgi:membrane-bound serine protease (ClpP class)
LRRLRAALAIALLIAFAVQFAPAAAHAQTCSVPQKGVYYVASLNADIDPGASDFLASSVSNAEASCAGYFVFVLTTNGGDGGDMETMVGSITSYEQWGGNFTTLVAPAGAYDFSAGSYISEASTFIYMEPGTTIGSATPIVSGIPAGETNTTLTKDIDAFASYMETLTSDNGRNSTATGLMVTNGVSYPAQQALDEHVINGVINSSTIAGALTYLGVPSNTQIYSPGIRATLISILSNANVSSLLFLLGIAAVLIDIYHPTIILSVVGVSVMAVALFGLGTFGASPLAIILMVIGAAFIFLEVKTQHGISAILGVAIFIFGFLFVFEFPAASSATPSPTNPIPPPSNLSFSGIPDITYGLIVGIGAAIVIASLYLRSIREGLRARPKVNEPSTLIGREGSMESDLREGGRGVAEIASEEWSVTASQDLRRGDQVRVKGVQGNTLIVEKKET